MLTVLWFWLACTGATLCALRWPALLRLLPADGPGPAYKLQGHRIPIVGGICLGLALTASTIVLARPLVLLGPGLAVALGWIDDARKPTGLAWPVKLAGQVAAAATVWLWPGFTPEAAMLATVWLVVAMNAWNFLDNTDGVAAATGLGVVLPVLALQPGFAVPWPGALAGALLAVLAFNWPRARLYLGDAGSQGLGFLIGMIGILWARQAGPLGGVALSGVALSGVALSGVALLDLVQVVTIRLALGVPPWRGDRRHLAHRLQAVLPTPAVAPCFFAMQAVLTLLVLTAQH